MSFQATGLARGAAVRLSLGLAAAAILLLLAVFVSWGPAPLAEAQSAPVNEADRVFTDLDAGAFLTCGVSKAGYVRCWGDTVRGPIRSDEAGYVEVATDGLEITCGRRSNGIVNCWAAGYGLGPSPGPVTPPQPPTVDGGDRDGAPHTFSAIGAGAKHACGLLDGRNGQTEGLVKCWGAGQVPADLATLTFDWTALSVDGSHIDVDRHLPLRCHLINLGGCVITYGHDFGCRLFSEPTLAVEEIDLYLRSPDGARGETLIAGPLLGALRTVREVERLADAVESLPDDRPVLALLDGTLAFWDLQRSQYPRYVADMLIGERLQPALARLRAASTDRRPVAVAAYTSRPRTTEVAGALRLVLCDQGDADCNRLCTARHSDLPSCDGAAGFDDRELFELVLEPGHRSPLYRSSHLAARFALGLATGQEWSHFYYLNGGSEIARVEVPDWLAEDPELLALSHAMLVKQCELGLGYPVAISEAHEQAVITGHDREEFRRLTLMLLEQRGLSTTESAKAFSKRRPWV